MTFNGVNLFDWVPYFMELAEKLSAIGSSSNRDEILKNKAGESFGFDSSIYTYSLTDPFSFVYFLAQRNTTHQKQDYYSKVKESLGLNNPIPTDWVFPTPTPHTAALFHDAVHFETDLLWKLFIAATKGEELENTDFKKALTIKTVKTAKLTQTLFLINPKRYLPVDNKTLSLPIFQSINKTAISKQIESEGIGIYNNILSRVKDSFPGCQLYEVNLLASSFSSGELKVNNKIFQISSNAYNTGDIIEDFNKENAVWTGGPTSGEEGIYTYPVTDPKVGDIMIVRTGNLQVRSINIVLANEYQAAGKWTDEGRIKVLRVVALDKNMESNQFTRKEAINQISREKEKLIRDLYPETFNIIDKLSGKSKSMAEITNDKVKNLILQGAPGTGKTRLAKQLALYLQTENSSLTEYLINPEVHNKNEIFKNDPVIEREDELIKIVQFHPSYTYEDFVKGIITYVDKEGKVGYKVQNKILMDIVNAAIENPTGKYVLIVDEINRANLPSVFGELIYALEYRGESVESLYEDDESNSKDISIPENLYFIGTMNTADRSIGHIDYAIRRRFVFKEVNSDISVITDEKAKALYLKVEELFSDEHRSPDFIKEDIMLGHSYFLNHKTPIKHRLEFEIIPILKEYVKDGILIGEDIVTKIRDLKNYV